MNPTTSKTPIAPTAEGDHEEKVADHIDEGAIEAEGERAVSDGSGLDTDADLDHDLEDDLEDDDSDRAPSGLGAAAAAVVAAGLGVVGLTGAWTGRVVAERETLLGQMKTASGGSVARQISEIYGDAWHSTALVNGLFALLALLVGVFALVRPAFGAPAKDPQPGWVRAVATAGIALGVLGVLISVGMYFDLIVALPAASAAAG
ncbi:hypothetical protein OG830_27070 [Streptomyces sp. NBC_00121]|uniref:hypothetical protein n=1 Tax=unclassified Streptomyces TaxID=2593676 RepID=UPI002DD9368C|nr:hypothetical protein [Streptomyces sp. NBC_01760]WSC71819.1 hypothetical protein OG807_26975 [Streptomyces sp. NBC_01760]WTI89695.1 hypothetical protein OHB17_27670 [Streptomyces sp. NBC_00724]